MQKKNQQKLQHLVLICSFAFLASFSIILGKYLALNFGESIRISFENLPILFAGFFFGPVAGASVAVTADIVGCFLVGYAINPIITLGACSIGFISGILGKKALFKPKLNILFLVFLSHLIGSVIIKTCGLVIYFSMPLIPTLIWRIITYLPIAFCESILLILLRKNKGLTNQLEKITGKKIQ